MRRVTLVDPGAGHVCNEWDTRTGRQCGRPAVVQIEFGGPLGPLTRRICRPHARRFGLIDGEGHLLVDLQPG